MPTAGETRAPEQPKPQVEPAPAPERELFAAEIEMERKSSNFVPMLFILGLLIVVGGTVYYFVKSAKDKLTVPVATSSISQILKAQGPATIRFSTGTVVPSMNEKPQDPHYKLLAKAGVIVTRPKAKGSMSLIVDITSAGETLLGNITGVQKGTNPDGTTSYVVPLAERKLLTVDSVTTIKPHLAQVAYTWQWEPNRLGREFDASGGLVKSFASWDRLTLIKSYGVDFYSAAPTKANIVLMETAAGVWKPYTE